MMRGRERSESMDVIDWPRDYSGHYFRCFRDQFARTQNIFEVKLLSFSDRVIDRNPGSSINLIIVEF